MATIQNLLKTKTKATVRAQLLQALRGVGYVRHSGTGTGSVGVTGTATAAGTLVIEVQTSGAPGTSGTLRYSLDGGATWAQSGLSIPTSLDLSSALGVTVALSGSASTDGVQPFVAGDTYTCRLIKPVFPTTAWQPFSVPITLLDIQADGLSDLTDLISSIGRGGILDLAEGDWLDLVASQLYEVTRHAAGKATLRFRATDEGGTGPHAITARQLVARDAVGARWTNTASATVPLNSSATLEFEALEAGMGGNVVSAPLQLETTVAGLRVAPATGSSIIVTPGVEREPDAELRERCKGRWATLGRAANSDGYAAWILDAVDTLTRVLVSPSSTTPGQVDVYLANSSGSATSGEISAARVAIREKLPTCVADSVSSVSEQVVTLAGTVDVLIGMLPTVQTALADGLDDLCAATPIGGNTVGDRHILSREAIVAMIMGIPGVLDCDLSTPSVDISIGATQVPARGPSSLTGLVFRSA